MKKHLILTHTGKSDGWHRELYKDQDKNFWCDVNLLPPNDENANIVSKGKDPESEPCYSVRDLGYTFEFKTNRTKNENR